ncbi:hypothetical protein H6G51_07820 [Limnothrix sp. FACHB-708]|uniref:hypothetical protein n=1 Tax=unclassified Limnothrix TaxID=2632864 RepID=UPI0016855DED|nr:MULTISPECIES: hypothetical protein [unclassified Limnothrix]MBD2553183.1 hypothetical protein [Limnothrix sp. FACHB-708]MBD2590793.1 hypothetical protein [Limnothrix sp. FACHB-406]
MSIHKDDLQEALTIADNLVFSERGKHLSDLEFGIITGVLVKKSYAVIAQEQDCTEGHVRDVSHRLWKTLSQALGEGEVINKRNLKTTLLRRGLYNIKNSGTINSIIIGVNDGNIHYAKNDGYIYCAKNDGYIYRGKGESEQASFQEGQNSIIRKSVLRMSQMNFDLSTIAEVLEIDINQVRSIIKESL